MEIKKKKIKFVYDSGTTDGRVEEIIEFKDTVTDQHIQDHFNRWLDNQCTNYWEEIE